MALAGQSFCFVWLFFLAPAVATLPFLMVKFQKRKQR